MVLAIADQMDDRVDMTGSNHGTTYSNNGNENRETSKNIFTFTLKTHDTTIVMDLRWRFVLNISNVNLMV